MATFVCYTANIECDAASKQSYQRVVKIKIDQDQDNVEQPHALRPGSGVIAAGIKHEENVSSMPIPTLWRTKKARYSLQGEICPACERLVFPPRRLCPYCGREAEAHSRCAEVTPRRELVFRLPQPAEWAAVGDD